MSDETQVNFTFESYAETDSGVAGPGDRVLAVVVSPNVSPVVVLQTQAAEADQIEVVSTSNLPHDELLGFLQNVVRALVDSGIEAV